MRKFYLALAACTLLLADSGTDQKYWLDTTTQKIWSAADTGSGVSLSQAQRYCRDSNRGGFKDWTLPTIDELQTLFGGAGDERGYHVRGPIQLTGWQWSASPGKQTGEGWALDFGDGGRASVPAGDSGLNRALCVRSANAPTK